MVKIPRAERGDRTQFWSKGQGLTETGRTLEAKNKSVQFSAINGNKQINPKQNNRRGKSRSSALFHGQTTKCRAGRQKEYNNVDCRAEKEEEGD